MRFLLLFLTLLPALGYAAESSAAGAEKFPDADYLLLSDVETATYQADGTSVTTDAAAYKVLTDAGRRELRQLTLHFNSDYETLEVTKLATISGSGVRTELDPKKLSAVAIDPAQMENSIFDPANKVLTLTLPRLAVGDTLEITTRESLIKPRIPGAWSTISVLQSDCPILSYEYVIDAPASRPLASIAVKDEVPGTLKFQKSEKNGRIIYRWSARNVPQIVPEPGMPPLYTCVQRVLASTVKEWQEISRWYDQLCVPKFALSPAMKETVEKLTSGKSDAQKMMALFQFVSQKIRYTGLTDETIAPGYEPHAAKQTFERGHGVCRDKAALLVALLRGAGFRAYPVLFMAGRPKDPEVPNIYFNHAVCAVETVPGHYQLMDPTFETTTEFFPAYLSGRSYLVARPEGDTLRLSPVAPAEENLLDLQSEAVISADDRLTGTLTMRCTGIHDQLYREHLTFLTPEKQRRYFSTRLRQILQGAELETLTLTPADLRDMSQGLTIRLTYHVENISADHTQPQLLSIPEFSKVFGTVGYLYRAAQLETRKFPLDALPRAVRERFRLTLPPQLKLLSLPAPVLAEKPGLLRMKRQLTEQGGAIAGENLFALDTVLIRPKDYPELKQALRHFDNASRTLPIIQVDLTSGSSQDAPGADSLLLDDSRTITLNQDGSIEETHHIRRKLLNYAGVVRHSKLLLPWLPGQETITVTGESRSASGVRRKLEPQELRQMDAPWAGAVKRYPKGKLLSVVFPDTGIGSEIDCTIQRKINSHQLFYAELAASDTIPVLKRTLTLRNHSGRRLYDLPQQLGYTVSRRSDRSGEYLTVAAEMLPVVSDAADAPPVADFVPTFRVSDRDFRSFGAALDGALRAKLTAPAAPEVRKLAQEISAAAKTPAGQVAELRRRVEMMVKEAGPQLNEVPWSFFSAPETTLRDGVGNSADKALLYAALCTELKLKWEFAAISEKPYTRQQAIRLFRVPENIFTGIVLRLPELGISLNDGGLYAVNGTSRFAGKTALQLPGGTLFAWLPLHRDLIRKNYRITLSPQGDARITLLAEYSGRFYEEMNKFFASLTPEREKHYFESLAAKISQSAKVLDHSRNFSRPPGQVECTFEVPGFAEPMNGFLSMKLPGFTELASGVPAAGKARRIPFLRKTPQELVISYEIRPPEQCQIQQTRPYSIEIGKQTGSFYRENSSVENGIFYLKCRLQLPVEYLEEEEYGIISKLNRFLHDSDNTNILIRHRK